MNQQIDKIKKRIGKIKISVLGLGVEIDPQEVNNMKVAAFRLGWDLWLILNLIRISQRNNDTEKISESMEPKIIYLGEYLGIDTIKNDISFMKKNEYDKIAETFNIAQTISLKLEISHNREISKLFLLGWDMVSCYANIKENCEETKMICGLIKVISESLEYISLSRNVKSSINSYSYKCNTIGLSEEDFGTLILKFPQWENEIINHLTS